MSKRVDIKTGFICNNNCLFCVQAHNKLKGNRELKSILADIDESKKNGCNSVVFTGGEVTIRKEIFFFVNYAKKKGFKTIQIQSNARMLSNMDYCKRLIDAGANEFSPSLHGPNAKIHDYLTRSPGSFDQTLQAIRNLKKLNQKIIVNSVIVKPNYKFAPETAKILVENKVDQYQFAFVHAAGHAYENFDIMMPRMSKAVPYIQKGLQIGIDAGIKVMAEAIPFCLMKGYEEYCSELYIPQTEVRGNLKYDPDYKKTRVTEGKSKFKQCEECKYFLICEGPWKEYPEKMGDSEFVPVKGTKIEPN